MGKAGERKRNSLPRFVRHARKVVVGHLFRSSRKYRARPQLSVAAVRGEGIGLSRAQRKRTRARRTCTRGRVHLFVLAQPAVYQFLKDIPDRHTVRRESSQR